jgi:hypothetical protein
MFLPPPGPGIMGWGEDISNDIIPQTPGASFASNLVGEST